MDDIDALFADEPPAIVAKAAATAAKAKPKAKPKVKTQSQVDPLAEHGNAIFDPFARRSRGQRNSTSTRSGLQPSFPPKHAFQYDLDALLIPQTQRTLLTQPEPDDDGETSSNAIKNSTTSKISDNGTSPNDDGKTSSNRIVNSATPKISDNGTPSNDDGKTSSNAIKNLTTPKISDNGTLPNDDGKTSSNRIVNSATPKISDNGTPSNDDGKTSSNAIKNLTTPKISDNGTLPNDDGKTSSNRIVNSATPKISDNGTPPNDDGKTSSNAIKNPTTPEINDNGTSPNDDGKTSSNRIINSTTPKISDNGTLTANELNSHLSTHHIRSNDEFPRQHLSSSFSKLDMDSEFPDDTDSLPIQGHQLQATLVPQSDKMTTSDKTTPTKSMNSSKSDNASAMLTNQRQKRAVPINASRNATAELQHVKLAHQPIIFATNDSDSIHSSKQKLDSSSNESAKSFDKNEKEVLTKDVTTATISTQESGQIGPPLDVWYRWLNVDPTRVEDGYLLPFAKKCAHMPPPAKWIFRDGLYVNTVTNVSQVEHPLVKKLRKSVEQRRIAHSFNLSFEDDDDDDDNDSDAAADEVSPRVSATLLEKSSQPTAVAKFENSSVPAQHVNRLELPTTISTNSMSTNADSLFTESMSSSNMLSSGHLSSQSLVTAPVEEIDVPTGSSSLLAEFKAQKACIDELDRSKRNLLSELDNVTATAQHQIDIQKQRLQHSHNDEVRRLQNDLYAYKLQLQNMEIRFRETVRALEDRLQAQQAREQRAIAEAVNTANIRHHEQLDHIHIAHNQALDQQRLHFERELDLLRSLNEQETASLRQQLLDSQAMRTLTSQVEHSTHSLVSLQKKVLTDRSTAEKAVLEQISIRENIVREKEEVVAKEKHRVMQLLSSFEKLHADHDDEKKRLRDEQNRLNDLQSELSSSSTLLKQQLVDERDNLRREYALHQAERTAWEKERKSIQKDLDLKKEAMERQAEQLRRAAEALQDERIDMLRQIEADRALLSTDQAALNQRKKALVASENDLKQRSEQCEILTRSVDQKTLELKSFDEKLAARASEVRQMHAEGLRLFEEAGNARAEASTMVDEARRLRSSNEMALSAINEERRKLEHARLLIEHEQKRLSSRKENMDAEIEIASVLQNLAKRPSLYHLGIHPRLSIGAGNFKEGSNDIGHIGSAPWSSGAGSVLSAADLQLYASDMAFSLLDGGT